MNRFELQKLRDLPIEGVAERLGLRVKRHKSLCPFHEDSHPSLSYHGSKNTYRCFVCGATGGTIDLVMNLLRKDFVEACHWLADEHNVIIDEYKSSKVQEVQREFDAKRYEGFFLRPWLSEAARRFLFEERMLDERVVRWCRLTSWRDKQGVNWLQIPYYDRVGKLIGIQNRNLNPSQPPLAGGDCAPRFKFPQGSSCSIYNLPVTERLLPGEPLYITEGCSDCWAMLSAGHKAIAIPSATLLKPSDVEILLTLHSQLSTHFHMYPDRDEPGERLFLQLKEILPGIEHHQLPMGCKDFSDYYLTTQRKEACNG